MNQWTFYFAVFILAAIVAIFFPDDFDRAASRLGGVYQKFTSAQPTAIPPTAIPPTAPPPIATTANPKSSKSAESAIYTYYAEIRNGDKSLDKAWKMSEEYVRSKNINFESFKEFFGENGGGFGVQVVRGGVTLLQSETPDKVLLKVKVHYPKSNKNEEYTYLLM